MWTHRRERPDRSVLQRIVLWWTEAEMRDRSRLQVVPARLQGQPLLEVLGTETVVILTSDASGKKPSVEGLRRGRSLLCLVRQGQEPSVEGVRRG